MKKCFFAVAAIICSTTIMALNPSAVVTMKLSCPSATYDNMTLVEDASYSANRDGGADKDKMISITNEATNVFLYGFASFSVQGKLSTVATNQLEGEKIGFKANTTDANYTISFSNVLYGASRSLKLEDLQQDSLIDIVANGTYDFTINESDKGQYIDNRFRIYKPFSGDEGELDICYQYGDLTINNNPYTTNIVVKDEDGQVVLDKMARTTPQVISLSSLTKGEKYQVIVGDKTMIIRVQ